MLGNGRCLRAGRSIIIVDVIIMAEGGGDDIDAFAEFCDIKDENSVDECELNSDGREENAVIADDIFAEPDLCIPSKKEKSRPPAADEGSGEKSKREENPFSFKQFLKKDSSSTLGSHVGATSKVKCNIPRDIDGSRCSEQGTVPTGYSTGLPDFVQDHFISSDHHTHNTSEQGHRVHSPRLDVDNLPDFTLNSSKHVVVRPHGSSEPSTSTFQEAGPPKKTAKVQNHQAFDVSCKSQKHHKSGTSNGEGTFSNSLPDFLSDGPMLSNHEYGAMAKPNLVMAQTVKHSIKSDGGLMMDCNSTSCNAEQLKAENTLLSQQVNEMRELLFNESQRVLRMQAELESCRKKEAEETAALEKMVQQVEANLQNSTQRAAIAEATVIKLKHEIKMLQARIISLTAENEALNGGENCVAAVKQKAKLASDQITSAAASAEQTLRQLMSGVESLKIIGACLANIDKISEDTFPSENEKL